MAGEAGEQTDPGRKGAPERPGESTGESTGEFCGSVLVGDVDQAVKLLAEADALRFEAAMLLAGVDGTGVAGHLGYVSVNRMVAHRTRVANAEAGRFMTVARFLDQALMTAGAVEAGRIGWAQAVVLARAARGLHGKYLSDEAELVDLAARVDLEELERVCRLWRARADTEAGEHEAENRHRSRGLWMGQAFDGSCQGRFQLDAEAADLLARALDTKPDSIDSYAEPRTLAQRRADRLAEICRAALSDESADTGGGRATVDVVVDLATLAGAGEGPVDQLRAELSHGAPITGPGLDRLLCDASFRALVTDGPEVVLRYNRATPDIPPGLRRAVRLRDRHCQFHGCDRAWTWCDLHHLVPRNRGGPTTIENLALVCRHHHTLIHEGGWQLERGPDGDVLTTSP